MTEKYVERLY